MECSHFEERLSEYAEQSLSAQETSQVARHLQECFDCSALLDEIRSTLAACQGFPTLEPDLALVERILLRTSGRPRTRTLRELLSEYFLRPMLTPRFALGAALTVLFGALLVNSMLPQLPAVASALSPDQLFRQMDRGVQQIYGEGLKAYDTKNEWEAQFTFFKDSLLNKLGFMMEQIDAPVEGNNKPGELRRQNEKPPNNNSSIRQLPA